MIHICVTLQCNRCKESWIDGGDHFTDVIFRRDIEAVRAAASKHGWSRFRAKATASLGDYCPTCVKALKTPPKDAAIAETSGKAKHKLLQRVRPPRRTARSRHGR
jgi:hypothetical protein